MRRSAIADHRSPPRTSVAVLHALPVFYGVSSSGMALLLTKPSPIAVGDLRLSGAGRKGTAGSVSFGPCGEPRLVMKHRFLHVLFYASAPNCRNDRAAPAHGRSPFLGSCSRVLSDNVVFAEPDLRDVPPLPLHIWPQVTHADAARSACSCCCCRGLGGLGLVQ